MLVGEQLIGPLYRHGCGGADIAVVEGVMGLFDGRIGEDSAVAARGSTAHVAGLLGAPVVLVVDARGQSQSIAALLHGFSTFDSPLHPAGRRHPQSRRLGPSRAGAPPGLFEQVGVVVFGAIPRHPQLAVPSRHLGLVTAAEHGVAAVDAVDAMTELVAAHVDLAGVASRRRQHGDGCAVGPGAGLDGTAVGRVTVAMAAGKAFTFGYAEHVEMLQAAGAEVVGFDPLTDTLPPGTDALVLPGGFPEQFTAELCRQ